MIQNADEGGEGVKNPEKLADVICERPLNRFSFNSLLTFFQYFFQRKALDANRYATKKTIAQGLLDVALLTANASQLKYVLQVGYDKHPFYYLMLSLIIISMILQVS